MKTSIFDNPRAEAQTAFAQGQNLDQRTRKRMMRRCSVHGVRSISFEKACVVAIKYVLGRFTEYGSELHKLTLAWLRLGEKRWQKIITTARILLYELGVM